MGNHDWSHLVGCLSDDKLLLSATIDELLIAFEGADGIAAMPLDHPPKTCQLVSSSRPIFRLASPIIRTSGQHGSVTPATTSSFPKVSVFSLIPSSRSDAHPSSLWVPSGTLRLR